MLSSLVALNDGSPHHEMANRLGPIADVHPADDFADVGLDGFDAYSKALRDFLVGPAARQFDYHGFLALLQEFEFPGDGLVTVDALRQHRGPDQFIQLRNENVRPYRF